MKRKSRKIWFWFFTLLCLLILSVSCSSSEDGEESTDNSGTETSTPTVTAISPEDGATLFSDQVNVEFSVTNFTIGSEGDEVDGHVHYVLDDNNPVMHYSTCLLYTSPSPRDRQKSRMPSSA